MGFFAFTQKDDGWGRPSLLLGLREKAVPLLGKSSQAVSLGRANGEGADGGRMFMLPWEIKSSLVFWGLRLWGFRILEIASYRLLIAGKMKIKMIRMGCVCQGAAHYPRGNQQT
jgi:hypothetical protein